MKIVNQTKGTVLALNASVARSMGSRLTGLLGRSSLSDGEALIIPNCGSIHTFFMRFPIDVVFLNSEHKVVKINSNVTPFRLLDCPFRGNITIELPSGTISRSSTDVGNFIDLQIA